MARVGLLTTVRDEPSRRAVAALSVWAAVVGLAGVLALVAAPASSAAPGSERAALTARTEAPALRGLAQSTTTTLATTTTTTTAPPTTLVPAPPPTDPSASVPMPRHAAEDDAEPAPAPPSTEASPPPPPPPPASASSGVDAAAEQQLLDDHNRHRAEHGLAPLQRHPCMDAAARDWSAAMVESGRLRHNPDYAAGIDRCLPWTRVGENVGHAGSAGELAALFWGSAEHRANVLGAYQYVGIGVVIDSDGLRWATLDFAST